MSAAVYLVFWLRAARGAIKRNGFLISKTLLALLRAASISDYRAAAAAASQRASERQKKKKLLLNDLSFLLSCPRFIPFVPRRALCFSRMQED
jgi:hypothetical protein